MAQYALLYYQAARFANSKTAGTIYDKLQQLIFIEDCDLSAYRFMLKTTWYVVVIGEKPPDKIHVAIEAQLTNGVLVSLTKDVLLYLQDRRVEATQIAPWVEAHYPTPEE